RLPEDYRREVDRNRQTLDDELGVTLTCLRQVHGVDSVTVNSETTQRARTAGRDELTRADGQATGVSGLALAALTADCLPIAVGGEGAVAMLHAGWRGLHDGVIVAGIAALRELGVQGPLAAAIGPGAGPCCYGVGPEVLAAFA